MIDDIYHSLYNTISERLINACIVTARESKDIARANTRKRRYWRRHVIDLCDYALKKMVRDNILNDDMQRTCEAGIRIAMNETTLY